MKDTKHMFILIDAEKGICSTSLPDKNAEQMGSTKETYLNIIKTTYNKPTANTLQNREKLKAFSL
jgi:hypothetical protein